MTRRYRLKQRAERQHETRQRIVEAAIDLHGTVGIAGTTVSQIAQRAGVGRQTMYRHFPDELTLIRACSGLYFQRNPLPDPKPWRAIEDPHDRLDLALRQSYAYHRSTEAMISRALADAADSPIMVPYHAHWRTAAEVVASAWRLRGRKRSLLLAAIGHAITFPTWRSLTRDQGLSDEQAIELMHRIVHPDP